MKTRQLAPARLAWHPVYREHGLERIAEALSLPPCPQLVDAATMAHDRAHMALGALHTPDGGLGVVRHLSYLSCLQSVDSKSLRCRVVVHQSSSLWRLVVMELVTRFAWDRVDNRRLRYVARAVAILREIPAARPHLPVTHATPLARLFGVHHQTLTRSAAKRPMSDDGEVPV